MNVYVQVCIADVEADADTQALAETCVRQLQDAQPYHTVTLNDVEII